MGYGADPDRLRGDARRARGRHRGRQSRARRRSDSSISTGSTRSRARRPIWTRDALDDGPPGLPRDAAAPRGDRGGDPRARESPHSRTSGTIWSRRRTGSRSSATSTRGSASSATRTGRPRGRSARAGPTTSPVWRATRRACGSRTGGATSSTSAAWASRATGIRARPTRLWDRDERTVTIRRVAYDLHGGRARRSCARACRASLADRLARGRLTRLALLERARAARLPRSRPRACSARWPSRARTGRLVAWIWLVPALCCGLARTPRGALADGWLAGTVFFLVLLRWLDHTFLHFSAIPWPLTWLPIAALAAYCGLYVGADARPPWPGCATGSAPLARSALAPFAVGGGGVAARPPAGRLSLGAPRLFAARGRCR